MWHMLQLPIANDYVVSTGETHSVREFVDIAFKHSGVSIEWTGTGEDEVGINALTGDTMVMIDPAFYRPAEVDALIGDSTAFRTLSGWTPKIDFPALVERMVRRDHVHA
jgi:GDPmannose 4,6-dehydratase